MRAESPSTKWYAGVTRYQWLVLIVASLGWIFDAFEGQLYNITRADMLPELLRVEAADPVVKLWGERFLGIFLIGGTLGGWIFSSLADRWGRNPVMAMTILCYSLFSGLTAFATEVWQVGVLRFLVAMGVGGEWAVGAALVAEVFPKQARERASGIFHATSVAGLWLAAAAGLMVGTQWRTAYLIGVVPALLVLWVRISIKEPESWKQAKETKAERMGSFSELLGTPLWRSRAIFGALLAMVGLATFWGVVVAGQDIAADLLKRLGDPDVASKSKVAFGFIQTAGAGLGMLAFGPLSARWGRRRTFAIMHLAALIMTPIICWLPSYLMSYGLLLCLLPLFGFFAQGIHAGYAVYFPELFPTHLRATGAGFCFNTGRILAAPVLIWLSAYMKSTFDLRLAITYLGGLFLFGLVFLAFLPETKGQDLPE
ncbi:Predicted arabinose efflux permease, MFS family [Prosthecobacter debontii]|uniref:Predicted arabinose efflux permease, MFS family n=1 Tax=Prosthecobacter debontii TaxID=48467 RepID=A0A1T4WVV1_9BACT|nr:MFS transporter [Prosthecobacter debontii]SKA81379.1 Predicted arabinose efflux permease, MFS family [Prosthecobacter debontii]